MNTITISTVQTPLGKITVGPGTTSSSGATVSIGKIEKAFRKLVKDGVEIESEEINQEYGKPKPNS